MNKYNWQEGEPKNVYYNCWTFLLYLYTSVSITNRNPHLPPFHPLIKVGALSCNQQETEPALPTGRSGKVAGVGGSEETRHFYFKTCLLRVSHKREKCCWKKLATFSEFSRLPFQNKFKYKTLRCQEFFLCPEKFI